MGNEQLTSDLVANNRRSFSYSLDIRHRGQINEVEIFLKDSQLSLKDLGELGSTFTSRYEQLYGKGSSLPDAKLEIVTFRSRASAVTDKPNLKSDRSLTTKISGKALTDDREIYWTEWKEAVSTPIYNGYRLAPGNSLEGPCIVETITTSIVVHPEQSITMDKLGNFLIKN